MKVKKFSLSEQDPVGLRANNFRISKFRKIQGILKNMGELAIGSGNLCIIVAE
jgi:hypothetical protein